MLQLFGSVDNPLELFGSYGGLTSENGPISFLSNIVVLIAVFGGLFAFVNLVLAGLQYIASSGNPEQVQMAWKKMYMSLIGLIVIVGSFTIAAILGQFLFNDAGFIFQPEIYGPGGIN